MAIARTRASTDGEAGSAAQRDRQKRILDATLALASKGGYDAVQMRAVAERADVALGTLYRYFPSKIHLLVSALAREFGRTLDRLARTAIPGDSPYERMVFVLRRTTKAMQRDPMLTEAMTRAFMFADPSAAAEVNTVAQQMEHLFTKAMHDGEPSADDKAIARVIGDVWLSNLVAWVTRRASADDVTNHLELAARLLLRLLTKERVQERAAEDLVRVVRRQDGDGFRPAVVAGLPGTDRGRDRCLTGSWAAGPRRPWWRDRHWLGLP